MISCLYHQTPIGRIGIAASETALIELSLPGSSLLLHAPQKTTPLLEEAFRQLEEYFAGERRQFDLPLKCSGSPFRLAVLGEVARIPYGMTATYGEIAQKIGKPGASRAVGMANHNNSLPIFIPCHRVIGTNGRAVGYGGGIALKLRLLALEGIKLPQK